ncbi:ribose-phosphate diphosphokinase [Rickettsia endosymbiont of Oedothorax gibbosus]|uniref:ribose-phosphate diphosphokinase n=1 Tax=Rickettsia endosymbiont of Oedothorax gibbosus TaxID=931099 RepID=UPI002023E0B9|nr:ribose-phosphate diphosphokinase [Rickettsia endosymbiont of Oedothorax gibbosus]
MKILAGLSHKKLARHLAKELNCQYVETYITTFDDSETKVQILEDVQGCDVVIVQSISRPTNNHLMELLLLVDTVKRAGASKVTAVIPYLGYSRQDRRYDNFSPVPARLVANMLEIAGVDRIITVDLHSQQLEGFFKIAIQNLEPISLFAPIIKNYNNAIIVSPDIGGFVRIGAVNKLFNMNMAVINKSRDSKDQCQMSEIIGNVSGKHCLLIDDIVDSGKTLCKGAKLLMAVGVLSVDAFVTHPVLSGASKKNIENSDIMNIYITDTIETTDLPSKFHIISVTPIIVAALQPMQDYDKIMRI